jgi:hypothetical protein
VSRTPFDYLSIFSGFFLTPTAWIISEECCDPGEHRGPWLIEVAFPILHAGSVRVQYPCDILLLKGKVEPAAANVMTDRLHRLWIALYGEQIDRNLRPYGD